MTSRIFPTVLVAAALLCTAASTDKTAEPAQDGLLDKAIGRIDTLYLHPGAIDPPAMLRAGIQRMERESPDILVLERDLDSLVVRSGDREQVFDTADVETLPGARERVDQVIEFVVADRPEGDEVTREDLQIQALRGMLHTIDRHSRLIVGDGLDEFNTRFKGTLVGIGSRIGRRGGELKVIDPFKGKPADRAGLRTGDVITHIDGHSATALSVDDAVDRIRGPEGVPVVLNVQRPGEEGRRVFVIVRAKVRVPSVEFALLPDGVGYIQIDHFSQKTSEEVAESLDTLAAEAGRDLQGVVIDLRGNTGGSMRHAARIVNYFVPEGALIRTEGADGGPVHKLTAAIDADPKRLRYEGPVAVLVNNRTASGSEIVAGGLKYLDRSITIGTQTFGKGTVQKVYPLSKAEPKVSMKLTVARYLLPGDSFINTVGVTPDVVVGPVWLDPLEPELPENLREPAANTGNTAGAGGLDARRNPGGGREPMSDGVNAAPVHRLWYPRVLDDWGATAGTGQARADDEPTPSPDDEAGAEGDSTPADTESELEERPGWSDKLGDAGDDLFNDVELRLAHDLLLEASPDDRREELIAAAGPLVQRWQELQSERMAAAARVGGLEWATDPLPRWMDRSPAREGDLQERMLRPPPGDIEAILHLPERFEAGEDGSIRLEVRNGRETPLRHLRAQLESSTRILDGASFLLGDLAAGDKAGWTIPVSVATTAAGRADDWRLYLIDDDGPLGGPYRGTVETRGPVEPELELHVRTRSEPQEDGSAIVLATVKVRNRGDGETGEVQVHFGNPKEEGVERLERFRSIEQLTQGVSAEVELRLRVRDPAANPTLDIRLRARDKRTGVATTVALDVPAAGELDSGWRSPPRLEMTSPRSERAAPPTRAGTEFGVDGQVEAAAGLESVAISVGGDQVYSRKLTAGETTLAFAAPATLSVGPNRVRVTVIAADGVEIVRNYWVLGEKER